jgi:hypothetical protein
MPILLPHRLTTDIVSTVNQYGNSRAVPNMLLTLQPSGTFWFFTALTCIGGIWAWCFIPETAGRSLESMDALFRLPWYKIGLHGAEGAAVEDVVREEESQKARANEVEIAREEKV